MHYMYIVDNNAGTRDIGFEMKGLLINGLSFFSYEHITETF